MVYELRGGRSQQNKSAWPAGFSLHQKNHRSGGFL